jgi:hypothetical protein
MEQDRPAGEGGDDPQSPLEILRTALHINGQHPLAQVRPAPSRRGRAGDRLDALLARRWRDGSSQLAGRSPTTRVPCIGLVSKAFDDDKFLDETYAFAERLANGPSITIRLMKQAVYQCLRMDFLASLEAITEPMGVAASTEDHREAGAAFKAKRPPVFKGY